jgi:hypothetical protein
MHNTFQGAIYMYSDIYSNLKNKYNYDNFEVIIKAIENHFSDLFKLDALNDPTNLNNANSSYMQLFDGCMSKLNGLYTVEEVVQTLYKTLQTDSIMDKLNSEFMFVPSVGPKLSKQFALLEKLATNDWKKTEPLTFIDMIRLTKGIHTLSKSPKKIRVVQLNNLTMLDNATRDELKKNEVLVINLNQNLKAPPKWSIIHLPTLGEPSIYCESLLTEHEKAEIQKTLNMTFNEDQFKGGTANSLLSTGYMAISWLDNEITHAWNFDINADFHSLFFNLLVTYFGGDNSGQKYLINSPEFAQYMDPNFRHLMDISPYEATTDIYPANTLVRAYALSNLGQLEGEPVGLGDFGKVIQILGSWDYEALATLLQQSFRSLPPAFSLTLDKHPTLLKTDTKSVALTITNPLNVNELIMVHDQACASTHTASSWLTSIFDEIKRTPGNKKANAREEFYATTIVLALIRAKAKKPEISINLPSIYQLNQEEQRFIIEALKDNPYVTEFKINPELGEKNASLEQVRDELLPIFARNRWLRAKGYRPPLVDDYWSQAARYWLIHLTEVGDVLEPKKEHELFKKCVLEMGLQGLKHVFALLKDEGERAYFETLYGKSHPAFYAACSLPQYGAYLTSLLGHLSNGAYFPFGELGISYQPNHDNQLCLLIKELNHLKKFEQITFTECLKKPDKFKVFLNELIKEARANKWVGLIVIPELEDKTNTDEAARQLRVQYSLLNDIILQNRHQKSITEELKLIEESSDFTVSEAPAPVKPDATLPKKQLDDLNAVIETSLKTLSKDSVWPLQKGGATQLQLQQQQQIEQSHQMQKEQQKMLKTVLEQAITTELVDYTNIDKLLKKFWDEFCTENLPKEAAATLKTDAESVLKGFFHTWINVNPQTPTPAHHAIKKMTLEATQALLRKHSRLTSGLNPENLPKGFYTQRSKDGYLILCYSPELSYVNEPNEFTLDLSLSRMAAEHWEGDFRQFDLDEYVKKLDKTKLAGEDWDNIILFAFMQPPKASYKEDYKAFEANNGALMTKLGLSAHKDKIKTHWPIFLQAWQYAGEEGIHQFLAKKGDELKRTSAKLKEQLIHKLKAPQDLSDWALSFPMDEHFLRALGQVYYRYGTKGTILLLRKLSQLQITLGKDFFNHFNQHLLAHSDNFNELMNISFFAALDDLMQTLKPLNAEGSLVAWKKILELHMASLGWESLDALWRGFKYFILELEQLGLKLEGNEFDGLAPEHMLICLERILNSLREIPDYEQQKRFLAQLDSFDLTYGGVHYALQHEGFKYFNQELLLEEFHSGTPTYAPDLMELYDWAGPDAVLQIKRTLASKGQFTHKVYTFLADKLGNEYPGSKDRLLWLLHTQYAKADMDAIWTELNEVSEAFQKLIAKHLFEAVYRRGNKQLYISFDALINMATLPQVAGLPALLNTHRDGTVLEALSIVHLANRWDAPHLDALVQLFTENIPKPANYPNALVHESYKLAILFGADINQLGAFYQATADLRPIVHHELKLLINQLLSVEYGSDVNALTKASNWQALLDCINEMKNNMANTAIPRMALIDALNGQGVQFKYSKSGEFRAVSANPEDRPQEMSFFVEHEERLWNFIKGHILVPVQDENAQEALKPILRFLKRLQLNRTYLNEIEPLLASLEQTAEGHYWSATYFLQLLKALQPENEQSLFPISLLKVMLKEEFIAPKKIDQVERDFPDELAQALKSILRNTVYKRAHQEVLCQIAIREYAWEGKVRIVHDVMGALSHEHYADSRHYALEMLSKSKGIAELESRFENCRWLVQHPPAAGIQSQWTKTSALWLKAISARKQEEDLFHQIKNQFPADADKAKLSLILHILAFSTLDQGLKETEQHQHDLDKKARKLVDYLSAMKPDELLHLAQVYPRQPAPSAEDIIHLIKKQHKEELTWAQSFDTFTRQPFREPRADYGMVSATRDVDLQRMIAETSISGTQARQPLDTPTRVRLTLIFSYLKQLEAGVLTLPEIKRPISQLSPQELVEAFHKLSNLPNQNEFVRAQIWAVLFEVLGRTTRKYPHLAQQFALIANDIGVHAPTRVLQLATGEGKSHFVAMRAARHAALGKVVDVCTAKRTLAERDLEDYQNFFDYLNIKTATINPSSSHEDYQNAMVHYTTLGDLSLFLDEQSYLGQPIEVEKTKRVAIFDEFDFIRFDEGRKTEYNYARPTGKTPKQMTWFYQSVNNFYQKNKEALLNQKTINTATLAQLAKALQNDASDNEEHQLYISALMQDPVQLVQWLQSAHEAFSLQWGVDFTVREENIQVGNESYPLREIIPLSRDNQKMAGSTFSAGVHQLLAVRLNTQACSDKKPQNFHIHPESNIISSQVAEHLMTTLWGSWEGFTGTISAAQAKMLNQDEGSKVLHVPTNQRDLRFWHEPKFYKKEDAREKELIAQIKTCINKKQSMLFSCKNDKQVEWLKKLLTKSNQFSKEELEQHFIFYTNEEHETAAEVLKRKEAQEGWHGGKKQQAVGLVASGFGRGDNVGVEAVFLLDVNDTNDKLQKGGRTARNGAQGEVFQYYLSSELEEEEQRLRTEVSSLLKNPAKEQDLKTELEKVKDLVKGKEEQCFEQVMLLREYVFSLQNAANQGYHKAIAHYSGWGMKALGSIEDPTLRLRLTMHLSMSLRKLDKLWIDICSKDLIADEKISAIEVEIRKTAALFREACVNADLEPEAFYLEDHKLLEIQLVAPKKLAKPTEKEQAIATICSVMSKLPDLLTHKKVIDLPAQLEQLAKHKNQLKEFAQESVSCTSAQELINKLDLAVLQAKKPSKAWKALKKAASEKIDPKALFAGVSDPIRMRVKSKLNQFTPELQQEMLLSLSKAHLSSVPGRIEQALPLIEHLTHFTIEQQQAWGLEYITKGPALSHLMSEAALSACFNAGKPMSASHFMAIAKIIKLVNGPKEQKPKEVSALYIRLADAIQGETEQRMRMLTQWQTWSSYVPAEEYKPFLMDFCQVMSHFQEGKNWDSFAKLVRKTQGWINKGTEASYAPELVSMWHRLAPVKEELPQRTPFLNWAMMLGGKSWFQVINLSLPIVPAALFETHLEQLKAYWTFLDSAKQAEQLIQFQRCCEGMASFYRAISGFTKTKQNKLSTQVLALDSLHLHQLNAFINDLGDGLEQHPEILEAFLTYLNTPDIPIQCLALLRQVLIQTLTYQAKHPQFDYSQVLKAVSRFKGSSEETLTLLLETMGSKDGSVRTLEPLFDNVVFYLDKEVPPAKRAPVLEMVNLFYDEAKAHSGAHEAMASDSKIARFFNFAHDSKHKQSQRLIWMHLLQQQVFVKKKSFVQHQDYVWNQNQNDHLLQLGFNQYLQHTKSILDEQPPKKPSLHRHGDLTNNQTHRLLTVSDELRIIGKPTLTPRSGEESKAKADELLSELDTHMRQYKASWFKDTQRTRQVKSLKVHLATLTTDAPKYYEVLQAITEAKLEAMKSDELNNKKRWFKMNRAGESRFFNTLNQMHDLVLRTWSLDVYEVHRFNEFKAHSQKDFVALVHSLHQATSHYWNTYYAVESEPRHRAARFFNQAKDKPDINSLNRALTVFEAKKGTFKEKNVTDLMAAVRSSMPKLPGHLATLAQEVLIKGDALGLNLKEQPKLDEIRDVFKKGV